jgi:hypothetical protein
MSYGRGFEGSRLEMTKGMRRAEIAKLFRQDVKDATKRGDLPKGLKVSVRTSEYSGGGSITVRVTAVPAGFGVLNAPRVYADLCTPHVYSERPYLSVQAAALLKKLDAMLQAYNFDDSDSMTDYFHVRFYGHADFDSEVTSAERATYKASFEAGTLADPGEQDFLSYREAVELAAELKADPLNEQAVQAQVAAKALGAAPKPRATPQVPALKGTGPLGMKSPTHVCAAGLCTKGVTGTSDYCTDHRHMEGLADYHGVNIPRVPGLVNTIGPNGLPTRVLPRLYSEMTYEEQGKIDAEEAAREAKKAAFMDNEGTPPAEEPVSEYEAQLVAAGFI